MISWLKVSSLILEIIITSLLSSSDSQENWASQTETPVEAIKKDLLYWLHNMK